MDFIDSEDIDLELDDDRDFFGEGSDFAGDLSGEFGEQGDLFEGMESFGDFEADPAVGVFEGLTDEFGPGGDYQVIGPDTRKRIGNTRVIPWRHIVKITPPGCTGTLIAPNKVLTAAHCVYKRSNRRTYSGIRVIPGKNGSREPFGSARAVRLNYPSAYASAPNYAQAWPHDYAVITLDKPIGRKIGYWKRIAAMSPAKLLRIKLNTAGYPGDKGGQHLYWTYNRVVSVRGPRIEYLHDTSGGQSGSPVWLRWRSARTIVAVHVARDDSTSPVVANRGVAITPAILRQIRAWVRS